MATYVVTIGGVTKVIQPGWTINDSISSRSILSADVLSNDASYRPAMGVEVTLSEDAVIIWGGYISAPSESGFGDVGGTAIVTKITAISYESLADRRYVINGGFPAGYTMLQCITSLTGYLTPYGISVDAAQATGPSLTDAIGYDLKALSAILDELAIIMSGIGSVSYMWRIDPATKKIRMFAVGDLTAPISITEAGQLAEGDIKVVPTRENYANRVYVVAGKGTSEVTDTEIAAAAQTVFFLTYSLVSHKGYVSNNGVPEPIGVTAGVYWVVDTAAGTFTRSSAPTTGNTIIITYIAQYPYISTANDLGEQAANGLWEKAIAASDIFSALIAGNMAAAWILRSVVTSKTVTYVTRQTGLKCGQTQIITSTKRNISGSHIISGIRTYHVGNLVYREVTAVSGNQFIGNPLDLFKSWSSSNSSGGSVGTTVGTTTTITGTGAAGSGTAGKIAKWATPSTLGDSIITETAGAISVAGTVTATTFTGSGSGLTSLPAGQLTGTITSATQDLITRTGALVSGSTGAGFTVALSIATITGNLAYARMPTGSGTWTATPTISGATIFSASVSVGTTLGVTGIATFSSDITVAGTAGTTSFVSQTTGWRIDSSGAADFRYLFTDELYAKSFIADLEQALAGGQIITKSVTTLGAAFTVPASAGTATLTVNDLPSAPNMAVFVSGDTVKVRSFSRANGGLIVGDAVGVVTAYADQAAGLQTWTFTRVTGVPGNGGSLAAATVIPINSIVLDFGTTGNGFYEVSAIDGTVNGSGIARVTTVATLTTTFPHGYKTGDVVVISGASVAGYNGAQTITGTPTTTSFTYTVSSGLSTPPTGTILVNDANGTNAPYAQIVTWATSPIGANMTLRTRYGNLRGVTGTNGEYGMIAGTYAATGGQYFRASNSAFELHGIDLLLWDGSTNTIKIDHAVPSIALGNPVPTAFATGTGIWMGKDTVYKFRVGNPAGDQMTWDGSSLAVTGTLTATSGTIGSFTIGSTTLSAGAVYLNGSGQLCVGGTGTSTAVWISRVGGAPYNIWSGDITGGTRAWSIDGGGNVFFSGTFLANGKLSVTTSTDGVITLDYNAGGGANTSIAFYRSAVLQGSITTNVGTTTYNTTSDIRLKTNIRPTSYRLADLLNIEVSDFNMISDPLETKKTGFIAQQLHSIFPDCVTVGKEESDPWMVDYGRVTPLLVKSVQELNARIVELETRLAGGQ